MSDDLVIGIALTVADGERGEPDATRDRLIEELNLDTESERLRTATTGAGDVANRILAWAEENDADTIVMGANEAGLLHQVLFGAIPERIVEGFDEPVLMVRKHLPVRSTLRSWARRWFGRRRSRADGEAS